MSTKFLFSRLVGIDWGSEAHQVCMITPERKVLGEKAFPHSGDGMTQLIDWLLEEGKCPAPEIAVTIEVPHGPIVDALLDRGFHVFSINPKQLDRFRDRFSPAGAKDDRLDARVLADILRTDPDCLRPLSTMNPKIVQLREWTKIKRELAVERTRTIHKLRDQLWRYFPQFLKLGFQLYSSVLRDLWTHMPTPDRAHRVRTISVQRILKQYRIRRISAEIVLNQLRKTPVTVADGVMDAATSHIQILFQKLALNEKQINMADQTIKTLLNLLHDEERSSQSDGTSSSGQPIVSDIEILTSIPGVGITVLASLYADAYPLLQMRNYRALRCLCGVAPVTKRSGKSNQVLQRKACQGRLVDAVYHWSRVAAQHDPVCKAKYKELRRRGHTHGRALRSIGDRLLYMTCTMLQTRTLFDSNHGSRQHVKSTNSLSNPEKVHRTGQGDGAKAK